MGRDHIDTGLRDEKTYTNPGLPLCQILHLEWKNTMNILDLYKLLMYPLHWPRSLMPLKANVWFTVCAVLCVECSVLPHEGGRLDCLSEGPVV